MSILYRTSWFKPGPFLKLTSLYFVDKYLFFYRSWGRRWIKNNKKNKKKKKKKKEKEEEEEEKERRRRR